MRWVSCIRATLPGGSRAATIAMPCPPFKSQALVMHFAHTALGLHRRNDSRHRRPVEYLESGGRAYRGPRADRGRGAQADGAPALGAADG